MALKKEKICASGAIGEYWKLAEIRLDSSSMKCNWKLCLWKDHAHASSGAPVIFTKYCSSAVTGPEANGDLRALGYVKFKAMDDSDLAGAEDV